MGGWESLLRVMWALALGGAIAGVALWLSRLWGRLRHRKPSSLVTHFVIAGLAVAAMYLASGGRWSEYGLGMGTFHWSFTLLLWALPTAILTIMQLAVSRGRPSDDPHQLGPVQTILRVWIVASIAEEVLTRGLIQGLLAPLSTTGFRIGAELVSVSILLAALAFAAMHLVLVRKMGAKAAPVIVLAFLLGCVTGVYRQTTGSLIPAVIVHVLFNIGGTIPLWLTSRRATPQPKPAAGT
jgi:membrane protease YdiL (CAAX protease family)